MPSLAFAVMSREQCNQSEMAGRHDRRFDDLSRWYLQLATQTTACGCHERPELLARNQIPIMAQNFVPLLVSQPSA
jgi:hypothetical protein